MFYHRRTGWLYAIFQTYICPLCKRQGMLVINKKSIVVGVIDGFPEPQFVGLSQLEIPDLIVMRYYSHIEVVHDYKIWRINAKHPKVNRYFFTHIVLPWSLKMVVVAIVFWAIYSWVSF